ncbi:hypothetical protein GCM10010211_65810 [Streptomyces albospinus]|uniref:Uncharacterized protein n=1 Tax=Streptomyces albospinus TaxID=285515 RepID=A0ABQ2VIY9_9ACTN|nr:hypothetical protein GCM10010211_65810 [Streptomyces albospinus]
MHAGRGGEEDGGGVGGVQADQCLRHCLRRLLAHGGREKMTAYQVGAALVAGDAGQDSEDSHGVMRCQ